MRNVETLPTGRFKVRFRLNKKETSESFEKDERKKAERFAIWLDALGPQGALDKLYEGEQVDDVPALDKIAEDHIRLLTGVEDGYRLSCSRLWARTWGKHIGHIPGNLVTRDHVAEALNLLAEHYAPKSLKNQRGLLSGVLDRCVDKGYLPTNPSRKLRLPQGKARAADGDDDHEMICLTGAEYERLYSVVAPHYQPLVRFLAGTGCRWGEVVVLVKADFDLDATDQAGRPQPVVRIRRALKWSPDGKRVIGTTKTKKSKRTIALPREIVDDVRQLLEGKGAYDLVFTAPRGGMVNHKTFWYDHWRPALWRAQHCPKHTPKECRCGTAHPKRCTVHDVPPAPCGCKGTLTQSPRIHDLRHSHVSWLLAAGVPIHVVQVRLGHESITTTVDTYGHLLPDAQVAAAHAASQVFSSHASPPALSVS